MLTLYLKGQCKNNPTKNNHFLHETGDKESVPKFMKHFFDKLTICFYVFVYFFFSQGP